MMFPLPLRVGAKKQTHHIMLEAEMIQNVGMTVISADVGDALMVELGNGATVNIFYATRNIHSVKN